MIIFVSLLTTFNVSIIFLGGLGLSLKPNHHNQVKLDQSPDPHCTYLPSEKCECVCISVCKCVFVCVSECEWEGPEKFRCFLVYVLPTSLCDYWWLIIGPFNSWLIFIFLYYDLYFVSDFVFIQSQTQSYKTYKMVSTSVQC